MKQLQLAFSLLFGSASVIAALSAVSSPEPAANGDGLRQRISINHDWRFYKYGSRPDNLIYDVRPDISDKTEYRVADAKPTEATNQVN